MATLQQENEARTQLKGVLTELENMKASNLARKELGADLSFESGVMYFSRILRLFSALNENDLEDLSYQKIMEIKSAADGALGLFRNIQSFSVKQYANNPLAQRDSFINQARDQYDGIFNATAPAIAFTVRKGTDFARLEEQAKETLVRMDQMRQSQEQTSTTILENAQQVIQEVRRIAEEAGVSQHAAYFKNEADKNEREAKPWLYWTIALACVTALLSVALTVRYFFVLPTLTSSQSIQLAIPKLFLFTVLLSATIWTGRTYRAYRHNAVVNRHRQNALASFEAFAKAAAGDQETKNAVLLQATQCIFSPQATGYIQPEAETAMPHVLEVVRSLGKSS
jgi:hypothetical protein